MSKYSPLIPHDFQPSPGPAGMKELAPFNRIPVEIIQEIFKCCLPELIDRLGLLDTICKCRQIVETISLVCKEWNEIAVITPELWAYVTISERVQDKLRLYRSRVAPLCLVAVNYHPYLFCDASISRWRAIFIMLHNYPDDELVKLNSQFEGKSAPHLEMLELSGDYIDVHVDLRGFVHGVLSLLSTSSKVKHFRWRALPFPFSSATSPLDLSGLSRLTTIELCGIYDAPTESDFYIQFLSMCKCAKSICLVIRSDSHIQDPVNSHPVTVLPLLEELCVVSIRAGAFLPYFTFPKLKKLEINHDDPSDCDAVDQCYRRSSFSLTNLDARLAVNLVYSESIKQYEELPWMSTVSEVNFKNILGLYLLDISHYESL